MNIDTSNPEFQQALQIVNYTQRSLFLTGKAGTGKSTFLRYICEHTKKKHVVLAPTRATNWWPRLSRSIYQPPTDSTPTS